MSSGYVYVCLVNEPMAMIFKMDFDGYLAGRVSAAREADVN